MLETFQVAKFDKTCDGRRGAGRTIGRTPAKATVSHRPRHSRRQKIARLERAVSYEDGISRISRIYEQTVNAVQLGGLIGNAFSMAAFHVLSKEHRVFRRKSGCPLGIK
jgi:hypothetical protein